MKCSECKQRKWEDGDIEVAPPGWGFWYCALTQAPASLTEDEAYGRSEPKACPIVEAMDAAKAECEKLAEARTLAV